MTWYLAAFLSAVFAALTTIPVKIGIQNVNSNLGTAIRTSVILFFTWGIVFVQGGLSGLGQIKTQAGYFWSCQASLPVYPGCFIFGRSSWATPAKSCRSIN